MNDYIDAKILSEVGEKALVREITESLTKPDILIDGYGNDAAFIDFSLDDDELLAVNTDRSGLNLAFQLGLAGAECVGDLGVSHAISDIVAAGGKPVAVTVALLLPPDTEVGFVRSVMKGAEQASRKYGAIIAGGDTKQNPKFAMVVTAIGKVKKSERLGRNTAKHGDSLVVTGYLGTMLLGSKAFRDNDDIPDNLYDILKNALVHQNPPFKLGRALGSARVANACIDISDGLAGALYSICNTSNLGAVIEEENIPIHPLLVNHTNSYGLRRIHLSLAGGDWEYLYSIPDNAISTAKSIAKEVGYNFQIIGKTTQPGLIAIKTLEGEYRHLSRIEHDSFTDGMKGSGYFEMLAQPQVFFGEPINPAIIEEFLNTYKTS